PDIPPGVTCSVPATAILSAAISSDAESPNPNSENCASPGTSSWSISALNARPFWTGLSEILTSENLTLVTNSCAPVESSPTLNSGCSGASSAGMLMPLMIGPAAADSLVNASADSAAATARGMLLPTGWSRPAWTARVSVAVVPPASLATVWISVSPCGRSMTALNDPSGCTVASTPLTSTL